MTEANQEMSKEQVEAELTQLFVPYRGFCARKGVCSCSLCELEYNDIT